MRVLLVSSWPYSPSSRGMDVFTRAFLAEGWDTTHLTFPNVFYTPDINVAEGDGLVCIIARRSALPYVDKFMWWFPRCLYRFVKWLNVRSVRGIVDFSKYDMVVLESGKPLFLLDAIPGDFPVIYRQSDSVRLALGKGRHYVAEEDRAFARAKRIILKKEALRHYVRPPECQAKSIVIENGMALNGSERGQPNPFPKGSRNSVYVGLHPLDPDTLDALCRDVPDLSVHIAGPCLRPRAVRRLRRHGNFRYYDFIGKEDYLPMLEHADAAIFPFVRTDEMKWYGLTSKFLHFMFYRLPIVSYSTGLPGEFQGLNIEFVDSREEFVNAVRQVIGWGSVEYAIDFTRRFDGSVGHEYRSFIRNKLV